MDWFVAQAERETSSASDELAYRGHCCYQPKFRERCIVRGKKTWRERFFLGSYILIEIQLKISAIGTLVWDWAEQFHDISSARGVRRVLAVDGMPLLAREHEVLHLRGHEDHRGFVPAPGQLVAGERVFINSGAFADKFATYKSSSAKFDYVEIEGLAVGLVALPRGPRRAIARA